ncbi:hypothetical protein D3C77_560660 [compost metagenome]
MHRFAAVPELQLVFLPRQYVLVVVQRKIRFHFPAALLHVERTGSAVLPHQAMITLGHTGFQLIIRIGFAINLNRLAKIDLFR